MPRSANKTKPAALTINPKLNRVSAGGEVYDAAPKSSPMELEGIDLSSFGGDLSPFGGDFGPHLLNLPPLPQSPPGSPANQKDQSKTFLTNFKTRLSPDLEQRADPPKVRQTKDEEEFRPGSSSMSKIYHLRKHPGSTPELSLVGGSAENVDKDASEVDNTPFAETRPQASPQPSEDNVIKRKDKGFRNPLARSKSIRRDSSSKAKPSETPSFESPPKTAPLPNNWASQENMLLKPKGKAKRGKSAERAVTSESEENLAQERPQTKDKEKSGFVVGSKSVMNKARTGGGQLLTRLGKIGRSASSYEREIPDSEYELKIIQLPLIEQTRITRISKDLVSCKDKTEYWMPSLPWRCIDYLNLNCESEGLYRVPGSGPQVKHWQRRFDTEIDVDLLDEQDLYDPNIISSMLKSWLRDLPTEIFPKAAQLTLADDLGKENAEYQKIGQPVPQKLRDALSDLPPFNYYILFAITCHLSLLLSHKDKNKMDLNNLSICIGPCLDLERWLFNYLVGDWRHCWQGCFTEKQYLEGEKAHEQGLEYQMPATAGPRAEEKQDNKAKSATENSSVDERAVQSSGSNDTSRQGSQDTGVKPANENDKPVLASKEKALKKKASRETNGRTKSADRVTSPERKQSVMQEAKRPATAVAGVERKASETKASNTDVNSASGGKSGTSSPWSPLGTHYRSTSDLPLAPIQSTEPIDLASFQVHGQ